MRVSVLLKIGVSVLLKIGVSVLLRGIPTNIDYALLAN